MHVRTATAALLAAGLLATLTACSGSSDDKAKAQATASVDDNAVEKATGIPPKPMGAKRQQLLDALGKAAPDTVRYEDKAIDAARNQCSAITGGATRLDWTAAQRFTYRDVTTTEAQGKAINAALKRIGFCA